MKVVHGKRPETTIVFVAQNPSIARWKQAEKKKALNDLVQKFTANQPKLPYIETYDMVMGTRPPAPGEVKCRQGSISHQPGAGSAHGQNRAEAGFAAHHAVVGLSDAVEREGFVHRADSRVGAEGERVLGVDGGAGVPALD